MHDVTKLLDQVSSGNPEASSQLLPAVYDELRRLAKSRMVHERAGHTLQTTGLVHEAYIRLVDADQVQRWENKGHFFFAASEAMRRILVEHARRRNSKRRGGEFQRVDIEVIPHSHPKFAHFSKHPRAAPRLTKSFS